MSSNLNPNDLRPDQALRLLAEQVARLPERDKAEVGRIFRQLRDIAANGGANATYAFAMINASMAAKMQERTGG